MSKLIHGPVAEPILRAGSSKVEYYDAKHLKRQIQYKEGHHLNMLRVFERDRNSKFVRDQITSEQLLGVNVLSSAYSRNVLLNKYNFSQSCVLSLHKPD